MITSGVEGKAFLICKIRPRNKNEKPRILHDFSSMLETLQKHLSFKKNSFRFGTPVFTLPLGNVVLYDMSGTRIVST